MGNETFYGDDLNGWVRECQTNIYKGSLYLFISGEKIILFNAWTYV